MVKINKYNTAIYDVSSPCDYRCVYCRNDWTDVLNEVHADFEKIKENLNSFKKNGFSRVVFTGGEFFIIPFWKDVVEYSVKLDLEIWIITNGYSINKEYMEFLGKYVKRINISFHAHNSKLYNQIMVSPSKNAFNIVLENMKRINENNIELGIFFSPIKSNVDFLYNTIRKIKDSGIQITDVNVNRIVKTQSTEKYFKQEKPLNLFEHKSLVMQTCRINNELEIKAILEAYPYCFFKEVLNDIENIELINQPCFLGRKAIAFNVDGSMKLCPATHFAISRPISTENKISNNREIKEFNLFKWRNKKCNKCQYWNKCFGGCHAANGDLFSDDPLLIDDEVELIKGIDNAFFDILILLYNPFLSSAYKKADIQYTVFSKKYNYPIGIVALNKTKAGGRFFEIALIPSVKGKFYSFLVINKFIKQHPFDKIGWTVHKANLPSIKLLEKLNGGFFGKTVKNKKRIEAEGFFRPEGKVSKNMKQCLNKLIPESTEKFQEWLKEYGFRKNEFEKLNNYLKEYSNENN